MTSVIAVEYEPVIGLEVHAQLLTRSKMFCSCRADYQGADPNTLVCPVCLALPGSLPVINKRAVEFIIMTGLALNCEIPTHTKFDRKNYPYPDLMKGYQISQYDEPIALAGHMVLLVDGQEKRAGITRVHLEEDVAKLFHRTEVSGESYSLLDVNRAGAPLMEIVGDPDLSSPDEARQYLMNLRSIVQYLGVSTGNMEEGSFRCDANISVRPVGSSELGAKVEVKNMNSFRSVYRALEYEIDRQVHVIRDGGKIEQETRGWVEDRSITVSQRSKEYAHDYRYFPEPDLPPLTINRDWVEEIRSGLPELPEARHNRFMAQYGLSGYDSSLLTGAKELADLFEEEVGQEPLEKTLLNRRAKAVSNWFLGKQTEMLNASGIELSRSKVKLGFVTQLIQMVEQTVINSNTARDVFEVSFETGRPPLDIVDEKGLSQISDTSSIEPIIRDVIIANPQPVSDYMSGKANAIKFLMGQVMRQTKGQANPQVVNQLLIEALDANK